MGCIPGHNPLAGIHFSAKKIPSLGYHINVYAQILMKLHIFTKLNMNIQSTEVFLRGNKNKKKNLKNRYYSVCDIVEPVC